MPNEQSAPNFFAVVNDTAPQAYIIWELLQQQQE
jgi:hypothetical protein